MNRSNSATVPAHRPAGTRKQLAKFLTENSFRISESTLNKRAMEGRGPPVAYRWCSRDFYYFDQALEWARAGAAEELARANRPGNMPPPANSAAPRRGRPRKPRPTDAALAPIDAS